MANSTSTSAGDDDNDEPIQNRYGDGLRPRSTVFIHSLHPSTDTKPMRDLRPWSRLGHHAETPITVFKEWVFWNPFMWVFWNPKSKSKPILTWSWSAASDQKILWWRKKPRNLNPVKEEGKKEKKKEEQWRPNPGEERKRKRRRQCQELSWQYNVMGLTMCV